LTLKEELQKAQSEIKSAGEQIVSASKVPNVVPARSYPSPTSTYEEDSQFTSPFEHTNIRMRPMWKIDETAIQQRKVTTTALPPATSVSGIAVSPATTNAALVAVPDLTIPAQATGAQLQISWNVSASLSLNTATASFALFRDGIKIGQTQYGQSVANNQKFSVSQTVLDNPQLGLHSYSVYWATTAGTLTADQKSRAISALVLRPQ
jgi:hypothetical protein